jgi:uncharacterized membrane protein YqjE
MSAGMLESARSFVAGVVSLGQTRLELFGVEVREELTRGTTIVLCGLAAVMLGVLGIAFGGLAIVIAVPDDRRVLAALLVAAGFLVAAAVIALYARAALRDKPRAFDATLTEMARDFQAIKP